MRLPQRLIAATVLVALSSALAGCGSMGNFDPSDLLDFLDTKKKLPGERKPVFPEGVPGLEQGVPKDLYKGAARRSTIRTRRWLPPRRAAAGRAEIEEAAPNRRASRRRRPRRPLSAAAAADPDAAPVDEGGTDAAPPAPKPKKIVRKRTTAPPADAARRAVDAAPAAQQSAAPFPAPMPSGTFTR